MKLLHIFSLLLYQTVSGSHQRPMDAMADLTNDLGVCILQVLTSMQEGNMVFSPYGAASVSILLFEGSRGNTALEILRVLNLPWNALLARVGFRDMNRHLKTYFKSDGFLRGLIMSKDEVCFHYNYQRILRLYGFEEPERALTYPCHGFISYTPNPIAQTTSTTESSVSVTSSGSNGVTPAVNETTSTTAGETLTTTELSTNAENIVTELTQTSQTIMLFNMTTIPSFIANATGDEVQKLNSNATLKEEISNSEPTTTDAITPMVRTSETTTTLSQQSSLPSEGPMSTSSTAATSSFTQSSLVEAQERLNEAAPTTEITEMSQKNEVTIPFQDKTVEPSGSETILVSVPISAPSDVSNQQTDFALSESAPNSTLIESPNRFNNSRSLKHRPPTISKASQEILKNEMKRILDKYKHRNFTNINDIINEIEKEFKSNSSESSSSFPEDLLTDLLASTRNWNSSENFLFPSTAGEFNDISDFFNNNSTSLESDISSKEYFKNLLNSTKFKLFKDTLKKFHGVNFDGNDSFSYSAGKFDHDISLEFTPFNDSFTPFFNSSTETSKELSSFYGTVMGFFENATQSFKDYFSGFSTSTLPPSGVLDIDSITSTAIPESTSNTTDKNAPQTSTNSSVIPTLVSQSNFNKSTKLVSKNKDHVLPKKSISSKNENIAAASQNSPNYVNVLSLRQSKLIETKFDIKGSRPKKVFKRSNDEKLAQNLLRQSKNADVANFVSNLISNTTNQLLRSEMANITDDQTGELEIRKVRSTDDKKLESFRAGNLPRDDLDWFAVYDNRNTIRIPTFEYSAYLPYAYIDDLKSKVLEIPLDDSQYSLIILLPTHQNGLNYLLNSLRQWSVRKIHRQLRPLSVYAIIPKFRVASHVDLKPALYALGMKDVFYRYRADLSVMSPDARLFVKSVEQVVTVHVDKYPNAVYEVPEKFAESYFSASHPFVYFVIDKESKVSLVAGIMADPSKQHIHFA